MRILFALILASVTVAAVDYEAPLPFGSTVPCTVQSVGTYADKDAKLTVRCNTNGEPVMEKNEAFTIEPQWWRWGRSKGNPPTTGSTCDASNVNSGGASNCPLLTKNDILGTNLGAFTPPRSTSNGQTFSIAPRAMTYDAATDSFFGSNHDNYIAQFAPQPVIYTTTFSSLNEAPFMQGFYEPTEGQYTESEGGGITGLGVYGSEVCGSYGIAFGSVITHPIMTHFCRPINLATTGSVRGLDAFFSGFPGMATLADHHGFTAGPWAPIPSEWQTALGGPMVTGWIPPSIVSRGSYGPSLGSINPADITGSGTGVRTWNPLVFYDNLHQTLGGYEDSPPSTAWYQANADIALVVIFNGTRTAAFFGTLGSDYCYGEATTNPALHKVSIGGGETWCYDLQSSNKGQHGYPYSYFVWLYDLNDFKAVRDGTKQPWQLIPYDGGAFTFPMGQPTSNLPAISGGGYNPTTHTLWIGQREIENTGFYGAAIWKFTVSRVP